MRNNKISNLRGSIVAIVTPFNADGTIDYQAYERLLDFHIDNETNGIVVCGTTGEAATLTTTEYSEILDFTVSKINGRIPVIAGTGSNSTEKALSFSRIAQGLGVDGVLVVSPYYNKPTPEGLYLHYAHIAKYLTIPIILYNVPGRTGVNIPTNIVLRLANEFSNIVGIKEASGDLNQVMEILAERPEGFSLFSGDDALAMSIVQLGGEGCISVVANEIPLAFSRLMQYALNREMTKAWEIQYKYLNLMNLNFIESNPIPVKTCLAMMGMIEDNYRLPLCKMSNDIYRRKLTQELRNLNLVSPDYIQNVNEAAVLSYLCES